MNDVYGGAMRYQVISSTALLDLEKRVDELEGWEPQGGLAVADGVFYQAMRRIPAMTREELEMSDWVITPNPHGLGE